MILHVPCRYGCSLAPLAYEPDVFAYPEIALGFPETARENAARRRTTKRRTDGVYRKTSSLVLRDARASEIKVARSPSSRTAKHASARVLSNEPSLGRRTLPAAGPFSTEFVQVYKFWCYYWAKCLNVSLRENFTKSRVPGGPRWRGEIIHHYLWRPRKPHGDQPDQQLAAASGGGLAGRLPRGGGRKRGTPGPGQTKETTQEYPPKPILHFPPPARPENVR
ncbi:hypothetical protein ALC53_09347 [Atta colombica]|uniref:Uncharacterized protein n=1 Tax=Atta colombica TaxID=520822 RepID=A0A195B6W0_9HYME|nr:hypothetical protein ALC53_09347 [Atta colombica]